MGDMKVSYGSTTCPICGNLVPRGQRDCPYCEAQRPVRRGDGGTGFEYKSTLTIYGWPLIHVAFGRKPRGGFRVARGVIAIGQFGIGLITFAQVGLGVLFGFGQATAGLFAIGQFAPAVVFGIGQFTTGHIAIGQFAIGDWVLAQIGFGIHSWTSLSRDPKAVAFFTGMWETIRGTIHSIF